MAIRTWSFTKLWAVAGGIWLVAWTLRELLGYFDFAGLVPLALAAIPTFLAGAWAGTHPEIAAWPRVRVGALWAFSAAALLGASECVRHWGALAVVLAAPAAVLTLRWYELTGGSPRLRGTAYTVVTPPAPPPPPPRLPGHRP